MSFMNITNKIELNTNPCGKPLITFFQLDNTPSSQPKATYQFFLGTALFLLEELGDNIKFAWEFGELGD